MTVSGMMRVSSVEETDGLANIVRFTTDLYIYIVTKGIWDEDPMGEVFWAGEAPRSQHGGGGGTRMPAQGTLI